MVDAPERMNLPCGSCLPFSFSGVTRSRKRRRGAASRMLNAPPCLLPYRAGLGMFAPVADNPVLPVAGFEDLESFELLSDVLLFDTSTGMFRIASSLPRRSRGQRRVM